MDNNFEGWVGDDCFVESTRLSNVFNYDKVEPIFGKFGVIV
jgi:hypothetical protein